MFLSRKNLIHDTGNMHGSCSHFDPRTMINKPVIKYNVQPTLDISNSDISNSAKLEASI